MKCNNCKYKGIEIDHLKNHNGWEVWRSCDYPLPYHVSGCAVPMGLEVDCRVYKPDEILPPTDLGTGFPFG